MKQLFSLALGFLFILACDEAPLLPQGIHQQLNAPVAMALLPGTALAVVANANINLEEESGSLIAVDLTSRTLLPDTQIAIPSFAGNIVVDSAAFRLYVTDRGNDALLVYEYRIPGDGGAAISFHPVTVPAPVEIHLTNAIETDEGPFDVAMSGTPGGNILFVSNAISGSISVVPTSTLEPPDLDMEDPRLEGLPLISASNFRIKNSRPGRGANHFAFEPSSRLLFVTSTQHNNIYVVDTFDRQIEAMLDLSSVALSGGTRDLVISTVNRAYVIHRGMQSILELDVSHVVENGINFEVAETRLLHAIPVGRDPESVLLTPGEDFLYISSQGEASIEKIDIAQHRVVTRAPIDGTLPGELISDPVRNVFYVLNFGSDNISVLDLTTGAQLGTIQ